MSSIHTISVRLKNLVQLNKRFQCQTSHSLNLHFKGTCTTHFVHNKDKENRRSSKKCRYNICSQPYILSTLFVQIMDMICSSTALILYATSLDFAYRCRHFFSQTPSKDGMCQIMLFPPSLLWFYCDFIIITPVDVIVPNM